MTHQPRIAEAKKKIAAKKAKAILALYFPQASLAVTFPHLQIEPQLLSWFASARRAKATIQRTNRTRSIGHFAKEARKGRRKRREKRMEMAATTMV